MAQCGATVTLTVSTLKSGLCWHKHYCLYSIYRVYYVRTTIWMITYTSFLPGKCAAAQSGVKPENYHLYSASHPKLAGGLPKLQNPVEMAWYATHAFAWAQQSTKAQLATPSIFRVSDTFQCRRHKSSFSMSAIRPA